jgi:hypothetical protein
MDNTDHQEQQADLDTLCQKVKTKIISIVLVQTRAQKIHAVVFGNLAQYTGWAAVYFSCTQSTQVTILSYEYSTFLSCS